MDIYVTLSALALGFAIAGFSRWLESRPRTSLDPPLIKPVFLLMLGAIIILLAAIHLVTIVMGKR
jgi:hypothetical protein